MNYLSVCSGIEAATVAFHPLGWTPWAFAEIEKFPSAVLAHHYGSNLPGEALSSNGVPNLGDITKYREWPDAAVDALVGGTPCQSFSVAGLRKGLADPRGNLALVYLGIADRFRPEWLIWENVPGVLSSNGGRDFGAFLGALAQLGYGFAYRVLDAQYVRVDGFGRAVPQRRRRVFVVGHLGDWRRAAAVLFDRESLHGHFAPRREPGQGTAPTLAARTRGGGGLGTDFDCDGGLVAQPYAVANCLTRRMHKGINTTLDEGQTPVVVGIPDTTIGFSCKDHGGDALEGVSPTLRAMGHAETHANAGGQLAIAFQPRFARNGRGAPSDVAYPLTAEAGRTGKGDSAQCIATRWAVRRLTPMECERLQGFPDGYTRVPYRGKDAADGPRYKALGNSMAVNVMRWLAYRINYVRGIEVMS